MEAFKNFFDCWKNQQHLLFAEKAMEGASEIFSMYCRHKQNMPKETKSLLVTLAAFYQSSVSKDKLNDALEAVYPICGTPTLAEAKWKIEDIPRAMRNIVSNMDNNEIIKPDLIKSARDMTDDFLKRIRGKRSEMFVFMVKFP